MTTHNHAELATLRDALPGQVVLPADPNWDDARRCWNLSVDQRPAAVIEAARVEDVRAAVAAARRAGLRVAPQGTGHGSEALGPLDGAVLLKTSALRELTVDPGGRVARLQAGALADDAAAAAAEHGLAPALGFAPTVGVTGLSLGGGTGWLSRAHGLAANNIRALDVVTAAGEARRVDAASEPQLFWALRGGGGRFAIVTALEVELHPVAEAYAGMLVWPAERALAVLQRFRELTADVPESFTAVFRYLVPPPVEAVPPPLRGRRLVAVIAVHLGAEAEGKRLVEPLHSVGETLVDTFAPVGPAELVRVAGDPEEPVPGRGDGFLVRDLPSELVELVARLIGDDELAPLSVLELRQLGGALSRAPEGHGALGALDGAYSLFASGAVMSPDAPAAIDARLDDVRSRLAPWASAREVLSAARLGIDPASAFDAETWERLCRVRDEYDPDRLIQATHDAS
jgi:FAD/FMN-containing dehydrogenase